MDTNSEIRIFPDIKKAIDFIKATECNSLKNSSFRNMIASNPIVAIAPDGQFSPFDCYKNKAEDVKYIMNRLQSGRYNLKPNLRDHKFLFRGETEFHSPCKPSMFRDPKKTYFLDHNIYTDEMRCVILSHPLVQLLDTGIKLGERNCVFEMNLYGLAQHYYNNTALLDLTSDIDVAAFFATQAYNWGTDTYSPITDENHREGVLYYYEINETMDFSPESNPHYISAIGLQVFPRSGNQKGFLINGINKEDDFNDCKNVRLIKFKHNAAIANEISAKFNGGEKLFPKDVLSDHWRSVKRKTNVVSRIAVEMNRKMNPKDTVEKLISKLRVQYNIETEDYVPALTRDELHEFYASVKRDGIWENFCRQIYIPNDKNGRMMDDLLNVPNRDEYKWAFEEDVPRNINFSQGYMLRYYKDILEGKI